VTALALAVPLALAATAAPAEDFCDALAIPEPLDLVCRVDTDGRTVVHGRDSPFPTLNRLQVRRLDDPVDDPSRWLEEQMMLDTSGMRETLRDWMTHPDNPLKPEVVEPSVRALERMLGQIEELSQTVCEKPERVSDARWAMRCTFDVTVAEGILRLELLRTDGLPVAVEMRAASEQRARQFEALINGFDPGA
jgi:hypothetical protein